MGKELAVLLLMLGIGVLESVPLYDCRSGNVVFIADTEDLCRYHWCIGTEEPIPWRCPPGSRVPTWFEAAPTDEVIPCILDHSADTTCLRCDYQPDVRELEDQNDCSNNPCPADCTCQDLWQSHHCLCPGDVVPTAQTVIKETFFCDSQPCRNGAECFSQWDDYWCQCPRGYTGKNCEVPFCGPDTCMNGGTCTVDEVNYHCQCTSCFEGPCCETQIGNGVNCRPGIPGPGNARPTSPPATYPPTTYPPTTNPPYTYPPATRPPVIRPDVPKPTAPCSPCTYGNQCEFVKEWLCECNSCPSGQICYDRLEPYERECLGKPGPYGSQYTLTFSQDTHGGSTFKRVYINVGGMSLIGSHKVRVYTPGLKQADRCYVDTIVTISLDNPAYYDVPADCLNTETGSIEYGKVLKVVHLEGLEIVVTVANMDGDGYLAIPDSMAGSYYVGHSYDRAGEDQYITVVALEDNTQVLIQKPDEEVFSIGAYAANKPQSNVQTYDLNALESIRYLVSDSNLFGTVIVSNRKIHVWSGNQDRYSQKSQEQLATVERWGAPGSREYNYIIVGIADNDINTYDEVHAEAAMPTEYTLYKILANGQRKQVSKGALSTNSMAVLGTLRPGELFYLITSAPLQVTHNLLAHNLEGNQFYSAYSLIPSMQQYAQSYSFQTHGSRERVGNDFTRHYLTLVAERRKLTDVPDYFEEITIYHHNPETGTTSSYSPSDLGAKWVNVDGYYDGVRIVLPDTGIYYLSNPSIANYPFGAIYYAVSGNAQSQLPNSAFPIGYRLDQLSGIEAPNICQRCMTGPQCEIPVIHTCACNPCANFDDVCTDAANPSRQRSCSSVMDTTGNPFTLMFMQNRPDNTAKRELEIYATPAGTASQIIRVYTPFLQQGDRCYLNMEKQVNGFEVSLFNIPDPECYETIGSGTFNDKALRVESNQGGDVLVYAVNRDEFSADGWVAFPDSAAGQDFYAVCYSPATYGTEFAVLNIQDVPVTVTLTYTAGSVPDMSGERFTLQPGEVLQIQSTIEMTDLSGTRIQSDYPVNVYSGNIRAKVALVDNGPAINTGSRDHLVEQLTPVSRWGTVFHIQPIPGRQFGDQVKVVGSGRGTSCVMHQADPSGRVTKEAFSVGAGGIFTRDVISGHSYKIVCDNRVFVAQITKSQERGYNIHDPSLITVPPVEQYANRYIFNTPSFSGGLGEKRPYEHRLVLISARGQDRDGIEIIHNSGTSRRVSDSGTWMQVPDSDYYNMIAELDVGTSIILHRSDTVSFMCLFYGYDDRESLGFPIGMRLQVIDQSELLMY